MAKKTRKTAGDRIADRMSFLNPTGIPMAVGMAWYRRETYSACLALFSDANQLPGTFDDWLVLAKQTEQDLQRRGMKVVRAVIEPEEFRRWCADHGHTKIETKARTDFANEVAAKYLTAHTTDS